MASNDQPTQFTIIAIAGYAGAGKDTMADAICEFLPEGARYTKIKMADALKGAIGVALGSVGLKVDPYTENRAEKERLRPLFKEFGKYCRSLDKGIFARKVCEILEPLADYADVVLVPDMRYLNEHQILKALCGKSGWRYQGIYVETRGVPPANEEEDESICELLSSVEPGELEDHTFDRGDLKTFEDVAEGIVHSLYK